MNKRNDVTYPEGVNSEDGKKLRWTDPDGNGFNLLALGTMLNVLTGYVKSDAAEISNLSVTSSNTKPRCYDRLSLLFAQTTNSLRPSLMSGCSRIGYRRRY